MTEYIQGLCRISLSIYLFFSQLFISSQEGKSTRLGILSIPLIVGHTCLLSLFALFFSNFKKERHLDFCRNSLAAWLYTHIYISLIPPSVLVFFLYTSFFLFHGRVVLDTTLATLRIGRRFFLSSKISCFFFSRCLFFLSSHISRHCFFCFYCESLAALMKWLCLFSTCPLCVTSFLFFLFSYF